MIKIGIIGCGYWGPQHARNFHEIPDVELAWIADLSQDRLGHMKELYPYIHVTDDVRDVLESDVDGVILATPARTHHTLGMEALNAGKHLLIEKPLALNVVEASDLVENADRLNLTLMVGHTYLYNPAVEALRSVIQSGELGDIYYINGVRANLGLFQPDINVIWDLAPHDISILNYILDATPETVSARGGMYVQRERGIHDVAYVTLTYPGQVMAEVRVSWLDPLKVRRYTIVGSKKMAVYDDIAHAKIVIYDKGVDVPAYADTYEEFHLSYRHGSEQAYPILWSEPLRNECLDFVAAIRDGSRTISNGQSGLEVVVVLEKAIQSLQSGGQSKVVGQ